MASRRIAVLWLVAGSSSAFLVPYMTDQLLLAVFVIGAIVGIGLAAATLLRWSDRLARWSAAIGAVWLVVFATITLANLGDPIEYLLPAVWIAPERRDAAIGAGYTVVDPTTALSTHLSETIRTFLPDLLNRQQVKEMVDAVASVSPRLVEDLVPKVLPLGAVVTVLQNLLRELKKTGSIAHLRDKVANFKQFTDIAGLPEVQELENRYGLPEDQRAGL